MTDDTSRLSWQLLMVGPGIDHITPDIQDKLATLLDLLPATAIINVQTDAGYVTVEAAIMFTAAVFYTPKTPDSIFSSVMALPYHMYVLATAGTEIAKTRPLQYGTGLVLLLLVLSMNLLAILLRDHLQRKR